MNTYKTSGANLYNVSINAFHLFRLFFDFMALQTDVCIIGDGAIGKVAALGLAQAGYRVTLLGPRLNLAFGAETPTKNWDVRVYALNHVAQALLSSCRVWNALDAARVAPVYAMDVKGDGAQNVGHLALDAYSARVEALAWIVEDANLNQALDAALRFAPNVTLAQGRAQQLHTSHGAAKIQLDQGPALHATLVIGADGAQSWVRGQCDIDVDYRPYGQKAIVTNFDTDKPHHGVAYQWFTASQGIVALLPLPGQRVSLVWSAPDALANRLLQEPGTQLAQQVSAFCIEALGALTPVQPESIKAFSLNLLHPHAIVAPRVALVGDAAHVIHPLAGHGMNLGFADVAALLKIMGPREGQRDCGDPRLLSRYARARKEDILLMRLATDGLQRLFATELAPLRLMRNVGLNLINHLPTIKRRLILHALGK